MRGWRIHRLVMYAITGELETGKWKLETASRKARIEIGNRKLGKGKAELEIGKRKLETREDGKSKI